MTTVHRTSVVQATGDRSAKASERPDRPGRQRAGSLTVVTLDPASLAPLSDDAAMGLALTEATAPWPTATCRWARWRWSTGAWWRLATTSAICWAIPPPTPRSWRSATRRAALGGWRLSAVTLVVTLEPCPMCAGALVAARLGRLVFGATDPRAGACGTLYNLCQDPRLNHEVPIRAGVRAEACATLLTSFFAEKRAYSAGPPTSEEGPTR